MKNNNYMITKLQQAINYQEDLKVAKDPNYIKRPILQERKQFYSTKTKTNMDIYYIKESIIDTNTGKTTNNELFHSTSQLQIILFLRDLLYISRDEELPKDNEVWNAKRKEISYFKDIGVII